MPIILKSVIVIAGTSTRKTENDTSFHEAA